MYNAVLPVLMVLCIAGMRMMRHSLERAEERDNAVRGGSFTCEYRKHGGMEDELLAMKLVSDPDGVRLFVTERLPDAREETEEVYPLPAGAADPIISIYLDRGIWKWGSLKQSELIALDAQIRSLRFNTAIGDNSFDSNDELPKSGAGVFVDVYDHLNGWRSVFRAAGLERR